MLLAARQTTTDRARAETARERRGFASTRRAELSFRRRLREVARQVGLLVGSYDPEDPMQMHEAEHVLERYSEMIGRWARVTSASMIADVSRRDEAVWARLSRTMSRNLRNEIRTAPTGETMRRLLDEQVTLIRSLPLEAARRVHELALSGIEGAVRADEVARRIRETGQVTESRAVLIARTEVARTASALTQARAEHVGSDGYIWRTAGDSDVRNRDGNPVGSHRLLEGRFVRWDSPPVASTNGTRAHAGQIYNCRCYPEPVIPDVLH